MPYSLKTSGLATELISCVAFDDDGTLKDFVSGTGFALDGSATDGTGSWKGTSFKYVNILANGNYDFYGITFSSGPTLPVGNGGAGMGMFMAFHAAAAPHSNADVFATSSQTTGARVRRNGASNEPVIYAFETLQLTGSTAWPTDGTKFSAGFNQKRGIESSIWYCLESTDAVSSSTAFDATATAGNDGSEVTLAAIGGWGGHGNSPMSSYIITTIGRPFTVAEYRSLHDDWFAQLFNAVGGATLPIAPWNDGLQVVTRN